MFTGIIRTTGFVLSLDRSGDGRRLSLRCPRLNRDLSPGESIAVHGVCLTLEQQEDRILEFHLSTETLERTLLGELEIGTRVHVEPSLRAGDDLSGHFVTGHVDGVGTVEKVEQGDGEKTLHVSAPAAVLKQIVPKGSVSLNGVSLTPVQVTESSFSTVLIPETLERTTFDRSKKNDRVHIEVDILARYATRAVREMNLPDASPS